eukprot:GHVP01022547.1.p1 GENE.GHVP01022547.1~~GHVP01022547.1.p1  ORF type:complete len:820 (+),score=133.23 GHVP01022547.1:196-2460(+)
MDGVHRGIKTEELDLLSAEIASTKTVKHPDYETLAARIIIDNLHKKTEGYFSKVADRLYNHTTKDGENKPLISKEVYDVSQKYTDEIDHAVLHSRDFDLTFFGVKTVEKNYLLRIGDEIIERPQHMLMRVAIAIHENDIEKVLETYDYMSQKYFIHATPTLMNAGRSKQQMCSCFLLTMKSDSMKGIYETLSQCALISQTGAGIGLNIHDIRATGSRILGTNGISNGITPMLRVFDATARYADQGGSKRPGAIAVYLEPWHADIFDFLNLKKNTGKEEFRARDLFYGLWIPDLFMKRVENNEEWTLMCPNEAPGLTTTWGEEFEKLYEQYEKEGRGRKTIPAQKLWQEIITSQIETGTPYMVYKDSCNRKSNQKHLGTIKGSNLCTEIVQYTSPDEIAVCNLGSIGLPSFVTDKEFDFELLHKVAKILSRNLNMIIDKNYYPLEEAKRSNTRHRPIGLGVQGMAETFYKMDYVFDSVEARELNRRIFETIYHAALEQSVDLAKIDGTYESYKGSPVSKGIIQCDMWGVRPKDTEVCNWSELREKIKKHGVRNSLLVAPMPTASTSQILGFTESFEPVSGNLFVRRTTAGEFQLLNRNLVLDLCKKGLWGDDMKIQLTASNGSVQSIKNIPEDIKKKYRTVWEISQKSLIQMASDRAPYIDQSQSFNVYMPEPTYKKLTSMHFYGWKKGLKTGMYYLRVKPASEAIKFTVDTRKLERIRKSSIMKDTSEQNEKSDESSECNLGSLDSDSCAMCSG